MGKILLGITPAPFEWSPTACHALYFSIGDKSSYTMLNGLEIAVSLLVEASRFDRDVC